VALDSRGQRRLIESLIEDPARLTEKTESVERYRQMNVEATRQIPELIRHLL
jgi:hypothetical protein